MTAQTPSASGQRRYPRIATRVPAQVEVAGNRLACEIRDYCQTGFNLAFVGDTPPPALPPQPPLLIEFGATATTGEERFRVPGRAAHQRSDGVGVFVDGMPEEALRALEAAVKPLASPPRPATDPLDLPPETVQHLLHGCHQRYFACINDTLRDFFMQAGTHLREASYEVNFVEQASYMQAAQELETLRQRLENELMRALRERMQTVKQGSDAPARHGESAGELALVDENEFEDWLALSNVGDRIESALAAQLNELELRYGLLLGKSVERDLAPFRPRVICGELGAILRQTHFSAALRAVLYKAFGQVLEPRLSALLKDLDTLLQAVQPPPNQKRVIPRRTARKAASGPDTPATRPPTGAAPSGETASGAAQRLSNLYRQSQADMLPGADSVDFDLERLIAALPRLAARHSGQATPASGPAVAHLANALRQTMQPPSAHAPAGHGQPLEVDELLRLIDQLAVTQADDRPLGSQVRAEIESAGAGRHIAPAYQNAIEMASRLFDRARAEHPSTSGVEALLKRLELPLLKLALKDGSFLDTPDHPARQVVNLLDQFAIACNDQGAFFDARLQRHLAQWVDRLCAQAEPASSQFASVIEPLEKALRPIRQARASRVARLQEACEARERIRKARARVNAALENRLGGRDVPVILLRLIDLGWRHYMVLLEMRAGAASPEWQEALTMLDSLHAWLDSGPTRGGAELDIAKRGWLRQVERRLAGVHGDHAALGELIDDLVGALGLGGASAPDLSARVTLPFGKFASPEAVGEPLTDWLESLRIGDWWDLSIDGVWRPMQLIWLSQPPASCAFANRSATQKLELDLAEFDRQRRVGLARPDPDLELPLLDRSEYALLDDSLCRMLHQVTHDPLTGLINRKGFMQRLHQASHEATLDQSHCIGLLEFEECRLIYNSCGMEAGDALLRDLTAEIRTRVRPEDVLARLTENTFAVFLPACDRATGQQVMERLLRQIRDYRFHHGQDTFSIGLAIGLTEFRPALGDANDAVRNADAACLSAKAAGRNALHVYEESDTAMQAQEALVEWAGKIDRILEEDRLFLRCQMVMPIDPASTLLPYYEILLGIRDKSGELIPPSQFITAVERWNRSTEIDLWVMRHAFQWMRDNRDQLEQIGGFAINLSALSLSNPEILDFLHEELGWVDIPARKITFEITESTAIGSYVKAQEFMRQIRRYGCKFSLDDFGSGFASYSHLKNLRTDTLKIDGSFVKDLVDNPDDFAMVRSMNDIGHSLGMKTVTEFVASPEILEKLRQIGVDYAQGYAIHKPRPLNELVIVVR